MYFTLANKNLPQKSELKKRKGGLTHHHSFCPVIGSALEALTKGVEGVPSFAGSAKRTGNSS
ncbi:MAG: hypothetical protein A3J68_02480 [Candidatus Wildermuthbacteria bacterium RIFCSPHIGHO2_02_FULL_48_16]|uniref:Uncharacterized protein n=1 Tax=Candidatus Wildermuthbacteria bacterium RIFCSPHIGHO2_02_FULL_48_16 TaxID=1802453 RepID=A0A1G2R8G3_9BACT|nr:MAG: hypothetical protein A3J68_02480 [Candidatus Wildermuthbacteria bacterium RIFCSPHIGHO2_02_FULL_48_16]